MNEFVKIVQTINLYFELNIKIYEIDYKTTPIEQIYKRCVEIKPDIMFTHLSFHGNVYPVSRVLINDGSGTNFFENGQHFDSILTDDFKMTDTYDNLRLNN